MDLVNHKFSYYLIRGVLILVLLLSTFSILPPRKAIAATIIVDSPADNLNTGDGDCTLREAINNANDTDDGQTTGGDCNAGNPSGADTIMLPAGEYTLTINGRGENDNLTGDLDITSEITINGAGPGSNATIIQAGTNNINGIDRVFHTRTEKGNLTLNTVTIRHGLVAENVVDVLQGGAGVFNEAAQTTINNSTITDNRVADEGPGGGITNNAMLVISNSTITGNTSWDGGGIVNLVEFAIANLTNTTISGNQAGKRGGGVYVINGTFNMNHTTVVDNYSENISNAGGVHILVDGTVNAKNSIVADNHNLSNGQNCVIQVIGEEAGTMTSLDYNLENTDTCGFDQDNDIINTLSNINDLLDNGGPTKTHSLLLSSAALDAIPEGMNGCGDLYTEDQRGIPRPFDGDGDGTPACDIGSFESSHKLWDGETGDGLWSTARNWLPDGVPGETDTVLLNSTSQNDITLDISSTIAGFYLTGSGVTLSQTGTQKLEVTEDFVHSSGVLQHTRTVNNADVKFLEIDDGSGNIKYHGGEVNTTSNLGHVTVSIRAVDQIETFCIDQSNAVASYANRCYEVTADNPNHNATIKLWALTSEVDLAIDTPRIFRYIESQGWIELNNQSDGIDGEYIYVQADTPGFSNFLIAQEGEAPTAITLSDFSASTSPSRVGFLWAVALIVVSLLASLFQYYRKREV